MALPNKPLLILPKPTNSRRGRPPGGSGGGLYLPGKVRQAQRLDSNFEILSSQMQLTTSIDAIEPEHVIVFETIGSVEDFYKASKNIEGLEWLTEFNGEEVAENEDFHILGENEENQEIGQLSRRVYFVMSNQEGMRQLMAMWRKYKRDGDSADYGRGKTKWRDLFEHLYSLRTWDTEDRLLATGLREDWEDRVQTDQENINVEIELWFRKTQEAREESEVNVLSAVEEAGGTHITSCEIESIRYHSILVNLPISAIENLFHTQPQISLAKADQIMFFRPTGQSFIKIETDSEIESPASTTQFPYDPNTYEPVVALIDGMPIQNHSWLKDRIIVDDPDGISSLVSTEQRYHGTAMASLIINGDDDSGQNRLEKPIYVRPVMISKSQGSMNEEIVPENKLVVDIIHQAVIRMFRDGEGSTPTAKKVKIINLSICEKYRPFLHFMSPLARLIDWLSWEYNVLFVISAGNYNPDIKIPLPKRSIELLSLENRQEHALLNLTKDTITKKILSPAESLNGLTVGSSYSDNSTFATDPMRIDLLKDSSVFSPFSSFGLGYRNAVKPDILAPGGRMLFSARKTEQDSTEYWPSQSLTKPPGQKVASPSNSQGALNLYNHSNGTSNSAALVTRLGAKILESLEQYEAIGNEIPEEYFTVLAKTLLAHGASWKEAKELIEATAPTAFRNTRLRNWVTRFLGYGEIEESRSLLCENHRATTIGFGSIGADEAKIFEIPLPIGLSGVRTIKRMVVTLSWISPVEIMNRRYRKAQLWFSRAGKIVENPLRISTQEVAWQTARRGTLQHEIYEGEDLTTFSAEEAMKIMVNCKAEAGRLPSEIKYGLAVTIESADRVVQTVYDEVKAAIQARSRVTSR
ncbi:MAG: S8 family peptidase [Bdellovibrionota bacterium]